MQREAQAMARLSHPNVVGIYDVGVHAGDVFLAMEYIDGVTLRDWLKQPRSRREVLAVHEAGGARSGGRAPGRTSSIATSNR